MKKRNFNGCCNTSLSVTDWTIDYETLCTKCTTAAKKHNWRAFRTTKANTTTTMRRPAMRATTKTNSTDLTDFMPPAPKPWGEITPQRKPRRLPPEAFVPEALRNLSTEDLAAHMPPSPWDADAKEVRAARRAPKGGLQEFMPPNPWATKEAS